MIQYRDVGERGISKASTADLRCLIGIFFCPGSWLVLMALYGTMIWTLKQKRYTRME